MYIVQILKRKDAAALVVGVVVALIISAFISSITSELANMVGNVGSEVTAGPSWQQQYLVPLVWAVLQLVVFEVVIRLYVATRGKK